MKKHNLSMKKQYVKWTERRKTLSLFCLSRSHLHCWCWGVGFGRPRCWRCWRRMAKAMKIAGHSLADCRGWGRQKSAVQAVALACLHLRPLHRLCGPAERWGILRCGLASGPSALSIDERKQHTGSDLASLLLVSTFITTLLLIQIKWSSPNLITLCQTKAL